MKTIELIYKMLAHCVEHEKGDVLMVTASGSGTPQDLFRRIERLIPEFNKHYRIDHPGIKVETERIVESPGNVRFTVHVYPSNKLARVTIVTSKPHNIRGYEPSTVAVEELSAPEVKRVAHTALGRSRNSEKHPWYWHW